MLMPPAETLEKIRARTKEAMLRPEVIAKVKTAPRPQHSSETKVSAHDDGTA